MFSSSKEVMISLPFFCLSSVSKYFCSTFEIFCVYMHNIYNIYIYVLNFTTFRINKYKVALFESSYRRYLTVAPRHPTDAENTHAVTPRAD